MYQQIRSQMSRIALVSTVLTLAACGGAGDQTQPETTVASVQTAITSDTPFLFVERSTETTISQNQEKLTASLYDTSLTPLDVYSPYEFNAGAKLVKRSSLDVNGVNAEILREYFGSSDYDVKDLSVSYDGASVLFAAHGPVGHATDFTWNIYEYQFETNSVSRVIGDVLLANSGEDTNPAYTLDGLIVFSSDRAAGNPNHPTVDDVEKTTSTQEDCYKVGANEKPSLLHSMSEAGDNILQLTYGNYHDIQPTSLTDGRVAFLRWSRSYELLPQCGSSTGLGKPSADSLFQSDYPAGTSAPSDWEASEICAFAQATPFGPVLATNHYTLLRISPDGSGMEQLYETVDTRASDESMLHLQDLVQSENGRLVALLKHRYNQFLGGNLMELSSPSQPASNAVFSNMAMKPVISDDVTLFPNQVSVAGWYSAVSPYRDGSARILVSWSQCTTTENGVSDFCAADDSSAGIENAYGIWMYDPANDARLPIVRAKAGVQYTELAISQPHEGGDFPFEPYNTNYRPDTDDTRIVCDDPGVVATPEPTYEPSVEPSVTPTDTPTTTPSVAPTLAPTAVPPVQPTVEPTDGPSTHPSGEPAVEPSVIPTATPTVVPSVVPTVSPSVEPTNAPSVEPTNAPSVEPTNVPSVEPTSEPTVNPTAEPTVEPTAEPTAVPTVEPTQENTPPVANAGVDQSAQPGDSVMLDGSGSSDADGDSLTYSWQLISAPGESMPVLVGSDAVRLEFTAEEEGAYTFELIVNDGKVNSAPDTVVVNADNSVPVADAGEDQSASSGDLVTLDGSGSYDADGDALVHSWVLLSKPEGSDATLSDPESVTPEISIDVPGSYEAQLIVNDGLVDSAPDTVVIATTNVRPVADAGEDTFTYMGREVTLDGSGSSDDDGDSLTYSWSVVSEPEGSAAEFDMPDAVTPTFVASNGGTYVLQLIVNDGQQDSLPDTVAVNVEEAGQCVATNGADTKREFSVVIRDFKQSHPDFEYKLGSDHGIVTEYLGSDGKPVYAHGDEGTLTTTGSANFNQWYNDVDGVNLRIPMTFEMQRVGDTDVWSFADASFFPIDDQGWGNSRKMPHNYHFTLETHLTFDYQGGEEFTFRGDDDLWLYINGVRAIDIGGVHSVEEQTVRLDDVAEELGIQVGERYNFDLFFAERHTVESNFMFQTSIKLVCDADTNHSGHGDDTNPGEGAGTDNTSNTGTDNPNNKGG